MQCHWLILPLLAAESGETLPEMSALLERMGVGTVGLVSAITIFTLAVFVGVEIITKIPPTLHTPLMSGSNAISGVTLIGAIVASGTERGDLAKWLGFFALVLATINAVGGFVVTHRMLQKFHR